MSERGDDAILQDIQEAISRILSYSEKLEYENFLIDIKTQDLIIRNIEILGEAAKLLSNETKQKLSSIPWRDIAGTRDKLIHDYFGVNIDIVWDIVKNDIPQILPEIKKI